MKHWIVAWSAAVLLCGCGANVASPTPPSLGPRTPAPATRPPTSPPPTPTPDPIVFGAVTFKGTGSVTTPLTVPGGVPALAVVTYDSSGAFGLRTLDATGATLQQLVKTTGPYRGTSLFDDKPGQAAGTLAVDASAAWEVILKPITSAPLWPTGQQLDGTGDAAYYLVPTPAGGATIDVAAQGTGAFTVEACSADGACRQLVAKSGSYHGSAALPDGAVLVAVRSAGPWTLTLAP